MSVLAVNAGSSTLKFALYPADRHGQAGPALLSGSIEGLEPGATPRLRYTQAKGSEPTAGSEGGEAIATSKGTTPFTAALDALQRLLHALPENQQPQAVAHRVVHGGTWYRAAVVVDAEVMARLESLQAFAPLHQPHNLAGIRSLQRVYPGLPQIACFDTAFHADQPDEEVSFALPKRYADAGIRRHGFHGLSYAYLRSQLRRLSTRAEGRVLMAHLGNGASLCAMREGRSIATTMGFSTLDGLMMGTRCGALDPGVLLHLMAQGMDAKALTTLLYKESGLLGVSALAADMRTLRARAADHPGAARAIALFTHRVVRESGAMVACLQGLDLIAFTGGIGEHDAVLRAEVCQRLAYLGVTIDSRRNAAADGSAPVRVDAAGTDVEVWVIPTDEGRMAAQAALDLLQS